MSEVPLYQVGHEIGTSTGRTRRCGWLDLALVKYTTRLNGPTRTLLKSCSIPPPPLLNLSIEQSNIAD